MMSGFKERAINELLEVEGGYVNDPSDSGGETNYGVTERVARRYGYDGPMKDMPRRLAIRIYEDRYWDSLNLDLIQKRSLTITQELFDTGVNAGPGRAAEFLQRSLNVLNNRGEYYPDIKVDGDVGPMTISALDAYLKKRKKRGEVVLYNMLNCLQGAHYVTLAERREKDEKFMFGWYDNRVKLG